MPVRELTKKKLERFTTGWNYDRKRNLFFTWEAMTISGGKKIRRRGFQSKAAAEKFLEDIAVARRAEELGLITRQRYPTIWELFKKRLRDIERRHERVRCQRVFRAFLGVTGKDLTIDRVAKKHFKDFADERVREGVSKNTVNREITPLQRALTVAPDYFPLKDWRPPQVFRFKAQDDRRERIVTFEEYEAITGYLLQDRLNGELERTWFARQRTGLLFRMLMMTGLRHGEVAAMRRDKLDRGRREINVYRFKTERWKKYSPLTDTHLEILDAAAELHPKSKFFFSTDGKPHNKTYTILRQACKELGIPYGRRTPGGFILHDLRHSFTTILHHNLIDNRTTTDFTDNPSAVAGYQHSTEESRARAMEVIENIFGNGKGRSDSEKIFEAVRSGKISKEKFRQLWDGR